MIDPVPCSGNNPAFQGLESIRSVPEYLYHAEKASPFGRQLVLQLIGVSVSHYQVDDLELPWSQLGLLLIFHHFLQGFSLDAGFLSHLVEQV